MANILIIPYKARFDLTLAFYLARSHVVRFASCDPILATAAETNGFTVAKLYDSIGSSSERQLWDPSEDELKTVRAYVTATNSEEKARVQMLCTEIHAALLRFVKQESIEAIITYDRPFIDVAAVERISRDLGLAVCYLGTGIVRDQGFYAAPVRMHRDSPEIWQQRLAAYHPDTAPAIAIAEGQGADDPVPPPASLPAGRRLLLSLRYRHNPWWLRRVPGFIEPRPPIRHEIHRLRKRLRRRRMGESGAALATLDDHSAVFLPLQGDEVTARYPNPHGFESMETMAQRVVSWMERLGANRPPLIIKEHPGRPAVLSSRFRRRPDGVLFTDTAPIGTVLQKSRLVVTFNSLVGFEAVQAGIPAITLSPTFYCQPGLARYAESEEPALQALAHTCHDSPDPEAVAALIDCIAHQYQIQVKGFSRSRPHSGILAAIEDRLLAMAPVYQ